MSLGGSVHALVLCFAHDHEESAFKSFFNMSYLECGTEHFPASKLGEGDKEWAIQASDDMEVDDDLVAGDEYDYVEEGQADALAMTEFPESTNIRVGGDAGRAQAAAEAAAVASDARNDNLAVGMSLNRTFVNRGSQIGVFKHDDYGTLQYLNNVPIVKDLNGDAFAPSKMMLHEEDGKMLLLNADNPGNVYEMDLESESHQTRERERERHAQQRSGLRIVRCGLLMCALVLPLPLSQPLCLFSSLSLSLFLFLRLPQVRQDRPGVQRRRVDPEHSHARADDEVRRANGDRDAPRGRQQRRILDGPQAAGKGQPAWKEGDKQKGECLFTERSTHACALRLASSSSSLLSAPLSRTNSPR